MRHVEGIGGTVTTILEHARRLVQKGWSVDVYGEKLDDEAIRAAGASARRIIGWPFGSYAKRRFFAWKAGRAVAAGYDLVHGHGDHYRQDVLSLHNCVHAAYEAMHGRPLPEDSGVGRIHAVQLAERRFKRLIANSKLMRADVMKRFGVPPEMVTVDLSRP